MLKNPDATRTVIEIHPEVCFCELNGGKPMRHRKSNAEGTKERLALLSIWQPKAEILLKRVLRETRRQDVQADDVLDALVAHVSGLAAPSDIRRLVGIPSVDDQGLPMQMLFRSVAG